MYTLTIKQLQFNQKGQPFFSDDFREAIIAKNDSIAYVQALQILDSVKLNNAKSVGKNKRKIFHFELSEGIRKVIKCSGNSIIISRLNEEAIYGSKLH